MSVLIAKGIVILLVSLVAKIVIHVMNAKIIISRKNYVKRVHVAQIAANAKRMKEKQDLLNFNIRKSETMESIKISKSNQAYWIDLPENTAGVISLPNKANILGYIKRFILTRYELICLRDEINKVLE